MKIRMVLAATAAAFLFSSSLYAQSDNAQIASVTNAGTAKKKDKRKLYIDVHHLGVGKVTAKDVEAAHKKDLAVESKYGVKFIKYWFDESKGDIYCLVSSKGTQPFTSAHAAAHGLLPDDIFEVTGTVDAPLKGDNHLYLDLHQFEPGKLNPKDVAGAHQKDLAVQAKYGVNLINYWIDVERGVIMCLAQAPDSAALVKTHKEAHGLVPSRVAEVQQGQ